MINETIVQLYIKGDDDRFPQTYPILQTNKCFYRLYLDGFYILDNPNLTGYRKYMSISFGVYGDPGLSGIMIKEIYATANLLYIVLSDNRLIVFGMTEQGEFELEIANHDDELKVRFESPEPREADLQRLTMLHSRWQQP